jgi:L-fuconolactonase
MAETRWMEPVRHPGREPILEPELRIVDPHHHLFPGPTPRLYPPDMLAADLTSGHRIEATVFVECGVAYRTVGDPAFAPLGETEYVVAAARGLAAAGIPRVAAGIVGHVDLTLAPAVVGQVLAAQIEAAKGAFRGVRHRTAWSAAPRGLMLEGRFQRGFAELAAAGLSFDAWLFFDQLPELAALADRFEDAVIVADHFGAPIVQTDAFEERADVFEVWSDNVRALARRPNVRMKLGGLGMPMFRFGFDTAPKPPSSADLAQAWRPYFEVCLEAFGPGRCMFESNFPPDRESTDYATLWNAFKRLAAGLSQDEKRALFSGTAEEAYRLAT